MARARRAVVDPARGARDLVLTFDTAYTLGFSRPTRGFTFGGPRSFGTPGAGGSFAFADPDAQLGFAYVPSRMGFYAHDDPRELAVRDAVYSCLSRI